MPNKCNVYGCRGNYRGEPYTKVIEFPHDEAERNRWIDAMPNDRSSLEKLKKYMLVRNISRGNGSLSEVEKDHRNPHLILQVWVYQNHVRNKFCHL